MNRYKVTTKIDFFVNAESLKDAEGKFIQQVLNHINLHNQLAESNTRIDCDAENLKVEELKF